jgi:hypothetical protein
MEIAVSSLTPAQIGQWVGRKLAKQESRLNESTLTLTSYINPACGPPGRSKSTSCIRATLAKNVKG